MRTEYSLINGLPAFRGQNLHPSCMDTDECGKLLNLMYYIQSILYEVYFFPPFGIEYFFATSLKSQEHYVTTELLNQFPNCADIPVFCVISPGETLRKNKIIHFISSCIELTLRTRREQAGTVAIAETYHTTPHFQ